MLLTLTVSVLLLFVPGLLLAFAVGVRGWSAAGVAPLLTFGLVLVGIVATGVLDIGWDPGAFGWITAAVLLVVFAGNAARRGSRRTAGNRSGAPDDTTQSSAHDWSALTALGVVVGAAIGFITIVGGTGGLASPNQGFDALFHANMVESINWTGDASPSVASTLNGYEDGRSVYPDAFHAMASLISQIHGSPLAGINAMMACIPLIGGMGLVALLRSFALVREAAVAPVVLASTTGYPIDLIWRGPIWVFVFGITFVPAFLVFLRWALDRRSVLSVCTLGLAAAGLAIIHPSAALSAAIFALCLIGQRWLSNRAAISADVKVLLPAGVLSAVLTLPLIGQAIVDTGGGTVVDWPVAQSAGEAVGELLLYNYDNAYPQIWLALPALAGIVLLWRAGRMRWWTLATGIFAGLAVLAASYEGWLVEALTSPWWNDRFRFEGLVFLGLAVFAAAGIVAFASVIEALLRSLTIRWRGRSPALLRSVPLVGVILAVVLLGVLSGGFYIQENKERLRLAYGLDVGGSVSPADIEAFDVLSEVAGDQLVLNDPNDGSAWMWTLADVRPVFGAALTSPVKPPLPQERQILIDGLNCLDSNEDVRRALEELGVRYVYSSDTTIIAGPTTSVGFRNLSSVDSLEPVYERGGATIYEIDPVPLEDSPDDSCRLK